MTALKATTASQAPRRAAMKMQRRALAGFALAAGAVIALTGCGAGQVSQTASQVAAVNGNAANVGQVALRDVRFLLPQSEQYDNAKGGTAVLAFSAVNFSDVKNDELVSISTDLGQVKFTGDKTIKTHQTLVANLPKKGDAAQGSAEAVSDQANDPNAAPLLIEVTGLTRDVTPGLTYPLTFNFKEAGTVVVNVPVDAGPEAQRAEPSQSASAQH
ncbi:hypothetical protein [Nocardia sp. NPDC020380]|uniref:hypothetical protein n=1 Tax=Nocardia sp. NPDC020380 TaxID=3364309 RepID=UPI0037A5E573